VVAALSFVGHGLVRPECVLATRRGDLFTADFRGGVAHIRPDGTQALYTATSFDLPEGPKPNGIALEADGSFLFAHIGATAGGVWRLSRDGQCRPVLREVDGMPLPPANFVTRDAQGRLWVTVSTRVVPRQDDWRPEASTGFIVLDDGRGPRIVADSLGYTNECAVDPAGRHLYVNETYGPRRLSRFPLTPRGLGARETVCVFGPGTFPDGLAFDAEGFVWVVSIVSNRVIRIDPASGAQDIFFEDSDPAHTAWVESAFAAGTMRREHLDRQGGKVLRNASSLAFGGTDLRTGYLGCLAGDSVAMLAMPVAGHPPVHWRF
jgi:sugar lactone lactonase YvrE